MKTEQTTPADLLPEQQAIGQVKSRRIKLWATPVTAFPKVWLVLMVALAMVVLEGAFRKWVPLFGGGMWKYLMYFSKDIIFALVLLFPTRSRPSQPLAVFQHWLIPGCAFLGMGALVSSVYGLNPVGAVLTTRATIVLPIIALLAVPRLAGLPVRRVALWLTFFTVVNFVLGVEQNRSSPDSFLNRYAAEDVDYIVASSDTGVRATGTFSYITGIEILSSVGIWAGLALISLAKNLRERIIAWVALAAGFGCGLASVSRAPIVIGVAMVVGWLFSSRAGISMFARSLGAVIFCIIIATGFGITPVFSELGQGMMDRAVNAGDSFNVRAFGQLGEMVSVLKMAPLGQGFGTHQVGGYYAETGQMDLSTIESPIPRMVLETGALGLIGYLLVCAGALLALQQAKREAPGVGARIMLLATQLFLLSMFYGNLIFDHTASAFVWMIFAAVMAAAELKLANKPETPKTESGGMAEEFRKRKLERAPHSVTVPR